MRIPSLISVFLLTSVLSLAQSLRPQDVSGLYSFVKSGDTVQINVQPDGSMSGYVSRVGDGDSDRGQMLDMMFAKSSLKNGHLEFTTKKVHGTWFEFKGRAERGTSKTKDEEGYMIIRGTLTTVHEDVNGHATPLASEVEFKSFPTGM
ncbi:hypothetical protein Acid345_0811 [Candidatus Koribacter versatilis Ellin345]|uniref:DUF5666 domain-containing protein n=1 Tax=Koribacter versatilis (strain Ellin345) TaxID=204669 RepID=Q1ITI4_KORVE|nr:hypothetical protein [Candidatus Koribacter versatilis]ABF39816.1 hypothetical protein Acid345_0811 [Candidatus Koribacter versatilis Ellin345]